MGKKALSKLVIDKKPSRKRGNPNIVEEGKKYRFKKGVPSNPNGRPKGFRTMAKFFRDQLMKPCSKVPIISQIAKELELPLNSTIGQVFALKLIVDAMQGKEGIAKEVINLIDGKVPDVIRNEIINEAKASLDSLTDSQLRKVINNGN